MFHDFNLHKIQYIIFHYLDIFMVDEYDEKNGPVKKYVPVLYFTSKNIDATYRETYQSSSSIISGKLDFYDSPSEIQSTFVERVNTWIKQGMDISVNSSQKTTKAKKIMKAEDLTTFLQEARYFIKSFSRDYVYANKQYTFYYGFNKSDARSPLSVKVHEVRQLRALAERYADSGIGPIDIQCLTFGDYPLRNVPFYLTDKIVDKYYALFTLLNEKREFLSAYHDGKYDLSATHTGAMKFESESEALNFALEYNVFSEDSFEVKEIRERDVLYIQR